MRLWVETESAYSAGAAIKAKVAEMNAKVGKKILSRATRGVNELRNAELEVLKGQRSGPPARRTGNLRLHWNGEVKGGATGNGVEVTLQLESQESYAGYLEHGTRKMAPRPFVERIKEKASPGIKRIFEEPYS